MLTVLNVLTVLPVETVETADTAETEETWKQEMLRIDFTSEQELSKLDFFHDEKFGFDTFEVKLKVMVFLINEMNSIII